MRLTEAEYQALRNRRIKLGVVALTGKRWENEFAWQLDQARIAYLREVQFLMARKFRFDFVIEPKIAVEIDGAVHRIKGRFNGDREKGNLAVLHGWRVLHFSPAQVRSGDALALTRLVLANANNSTKSNALDVGEVEA